MPNIYMQLRCNDQHLFEVPLTSLKYAGEINLISEGSTHVLPVSIKADTYLNQAQTYLFTKVCNV